MADLDIPGLAELRASIDETDARILELLNRRARISLAIGAAKARVPGAGIWDPEREQSLLRKLEERNSGPLENTHVNAIWREVLSASRDLQKTCGAACAGPGSGGDPGTPDV